MRGWSPSLAVKAALAAIFLLVQAGALYDAAAHGEQPHDHYGISCELTKAVGPEIAPLPVAPELPTPPRAAPLLEQPALDYQPWTRPPGRAPPPRSPPSFHQ